MYYDPDMKWVVRSLIFLVIAVAIIAAVRFQETTGHPVASTTPGAAASSTQSTREHIAEIIAGMTLRQKVEGLLILHTPGTDPTVLKAYVDRYHPAGLIFMEDNVPATREALREETSAIQASTAIPYFIAIDEEGCTVKRLASDTYLCAPQLKTAPIASTSDAFAARSGLLENLGINVNFGIVADITADPGSFIYPRVFGSDPQEVAPRIAAAVRASSGKTLSTLKHFPGHGETPANSHLEVPVAQISKSEWANRDKIPFQAGVDAGAELVMFGQLTYSAVDTAPATLSRTWHHVLTDEMGFSGMSVTDDMIMLQQSRDPAYQDPVRNAVDALNAGNDLLLYVNDHGSRVSEIDVDALVNGIVGAVESGQLSESNINTKLEKILSYRLKLSAPNN